MKKKNALTQNNLKKEFAEFATLSKEVPLSLQQKTLARLSAEEWAPARGKILAKIIAIQLAISILSLTFCPQFNLSLTHSYALFHFFHHTFGEVICMLLCSSIFTGLGAFICRLLLHPGEFVAIKSSTFLLYTSYTAVALLAFLIIGADIFATLTLYWSIGSIVSGIAAFYLPTAIGSLQLRKLLN